MLDIYDSYDMILDYVNYYYVNFFDSFIVSSKSDSSKLI